MADEKCDSVSTQIEKKASENPGDVLAIVQAGIAANPSCACEVVKAAIAGAKADKDLVGQIVYTAVLASPEMAAIIAECAITVAPEAEEQIKSALGVALGSEKNPKTPPPVEEEVGDDFAKVPVDVRGIYLIPPIAPSARNVVGDQVVTQVVTKTVTKTRTVVIDRPVPTNPNPQS